MLPQLAIVAIALATSALVCGGLRRRNAARGLVDQPGREAHKQHSTAVPYGGGFGIVAGLLAAAAAAGIWSVDDLSPLLLGRAELSIFGAAAALFILGAIDDRRPLPAWGKLMVQTVVITAAILFGGFHIDHLAAWPVAGTVAAVLWCLLVTNAYNLLDHADGLSASIAILSGVVLLTAALLSDDATSAVLMLSLIGSLAGFLVWNWPPARLYMGDSGSLCLGFLISASCLHLTFWSSGSDEQPLALLAPLLVTAIPLYDTAVVVTKRLRRRQALWRGDRRHISHRLQRLGLGPTSSLLAVISLQTALAAGALQLRLVSGVGAQLLLVQVGAILLAVLLLEASRDHD